MEQLLSQSGASEHVFVDGTNQLKRQNQATTAKTTKTQQPPVVMVLVKPFVAVMLSGGVTSDLMTGSDTFTYEHNVINSKDTDHVFRYSCHATASMCTSNKQLVRACAKKNQKNNQSKTTL